MITGKPLAWEEMWWHGTRRQTAPRRRSSMSLVSLTSMNIGNDHDPTESLKIRSMLSVTAALTPPDFALTSAYPEAARVGQTAAANDWEAVRRYTEELPPGSDRTLVGTAIRSLPGIEEPLRHLVAATPDDAFALTLLGVREVGMGWEARGSGRAESVSPEQFAAFHEHLRRAERLLITATALDPGQDIAWAERLNTARGLQLGQSEARRRHDRLVRTSPHHFTGQARLLEQTYPKWGGSWEAAHGFAHECMRNAPEGALNAGLVVEAHVEHWYALRTPDARTAYLEQPHVRQEAEEAAARSVAHPQYVRHPGWVTVEGCFALLFGLLGDQQRAAVHFTALGGLASDFPWSYLGNPATAYVRRRSAALGRG